MTDSDTLSAIVATELERLAYLGRALPVDHDADRLAAAALSRYYETLPQPRKLKRKP